jgi:asparagine synthase (glutamine-hydrolysing)
VTAFLAAMPALAPDTMARALSGYGEAHAWREGPLGIAATQPLRGGAHRRCLLDGEIDNLDQIAAAAQLDPALPGEQLLLDARDRLGEPRLLRLLRGGFALLIVDAGGRRALAIRDQFGERGLVWSRSDGHTLIACESAELVAARAGPAEPDQVSLAHWLAVGAMPEDRTMLNGVRRLLPGHALEITEHDVRVFRYWEPPRPVGSGVAGFDEAVRLVRAKLAESVARRTRPGTGVLLSGGLDSSAVAALGVRAPTPVSRAYSAVFPDHPAADERPLIELTARALDLDVVTAVVRSGSVVAGSLPYLKRWLLPCATPNLFFWLPLLQRAVLDGHRRLLDGMAGDEMFGLAPALLADRIRRGDVLGAVRLVGRLPGARARLPARTVARVLYHSGIKGALPGGPARLRQRLDRRRGAGPAWLRPELSTALRETSPPGDWKQPGAPRWWSYVVATTVFGPGPSLGFDDVRRRYGLVGATARHPIADVDLLELVLSLPPELAYHPDHSRPLLRAAVDGLLPDRVRLRAGKSHFDGPFHDSLAGPDLAIARSVLGTDALIGAHIDLPGARAALLGPPPPAGQRQNWGLYLWRLLTAELWLQTLADRDFPDRLANSAPSDMCVSIERP